MNNEIILVYKNNYNEFLQILGARIFDIHFNNDSITAKVTCDNLYQFLIFLKYDFIHQLKLCLEITAYDTPGKILRFGVIYTLLSTEFNARYQVLTQTDPYRGLETATALFSAAN